MLFRTIAHCLFNVILSLVVLTEKLAFFNNSCKRFIVSSSYVFCLIIFNHYAMGLLYALSHTQKLLLQQINIYYFASKCATYTSNLELTHQK